MSQGESSKIVTFTNTYARPGTFANFELLEELRKGIDACAKGQDPKACLATLKIQEREAGRFPRGPIGSQSPRLTDYIDEDFRVVTVPNSVTKHLDMFILERTKAPVLDLTYQDALVAKEKSRIQGKLCQTAKNFRGTGDSSEGATATVKSFYNQLSILTPPDPTVSIQLKSLEGGWRLFWCNENVTTDNQRAPDRVYQLVTSNYIFNLGERLTPQGTVNFALRSPITALPDAFRIRFDQAYARSTGFRTGEALATIASALESDPTKAEFLPRNAASFPNGPIGATDDLRNLYVDGNIRVTQGKNASSGVEEVFVLERTTIVA